MTSAEKAKERYFEWQPHDDPEFAPLICGRGTIGGKGRSLLFALRRLRDSGDTDMSRVKVPRSIYFSIEVFHKFLERVPSLDTLLACGDPEGIQRVFLLTPLPDEASLRIREFLSDMHDPVVIRSSSRLEDDVKHSFAGKYLSTFLGNNKGTLEERAQAVEDEVRRIYSRTFFPAAEDYRKRHKLGDDDMGIIIIRMAGRWRGQYYYPTMGGVGYSQNFRRWTTRIRQDDGLVRIVFGLGTMSTKRGYARTVSLTNQILRPEGFSPEKIAAIAQEHFHVIDVHLVEFFPGGYRSGIREGMLHPVAWERRAGVLVGVRTVVGKVHLPGELQGDLQGVFVYQVQPFGAEHPKIVLATSSGETTRSRASAWMPATRARTTSLRMASGIGLKTVSVPTKFVGNRNEQIHYET